MVYNGILMETIGVSIGLLLFFLTGLLVKTHTLLTPILKMCL